MIRMKVLFPLCTAALALLGCQQESGNPAENAEPAPDREYALEVQKLKGGPEESFHEGLAALDSKFGFAAARTEAKAPAPEAIALEKTARQYVSGGTGECARLSKFIIKLAPGDRVSFTASSRNAVGVGVSDPVVMLIQLQNPEFLSNGTLPNEGLTDYTIKVWNDDVSSGSLTAGFNYTVKANQGGYYLAMAYPSDNAFSKTYVQLFLDIFRVNCPTCDNVVPNSVRMLGGLVFPIKGADDYLATQMTGEGNPRIYVNMNTRGFGVTNGNSSSATLNARAYPYPVTAAEGRFSSNIVIIDNDAATTNWFKHWQFKP